MAPSLSSSIDEGHGRSTYQANHSTNPKPIVPVIPRAFEKKTRAACTRAASNSSDPGENAVEGTNDRLGPLESGALGYGDACVPPEVSGHEGARVGACTQESAQADPYDHDKGNTGNVSSVDT